MDLSRMHFYKHMSGFYMHSISLPEKLTRQLAHFVGKLLELKGPNGSTWYVGLIRSGEKLVLQPGWNDFASANNISQNDHLIFKFVGDLKFEVLIFDPTGCEKGCILLEEEESDNNIGSVVGEELPNEQYCFDTKEKDEQHQIEGMNESSFLNKKRLYGGEEQGGSEGSNDSLPLEELRKILYEKKKLHKIKGKTKLQPQNIATKLPSKEVEEEDEERSSDLLPNETDTPPMKRHCQNPRKLPSTKGLERKSLQSCYTNYTSRVPWTDKQKSRAQQLANKVQAGNPYFPNVMKKYNLTSPYRMVIPKKFSTGNLKDKNADFILSCPDQGKSWFVLSYFGSRRKEQVVRGPTWEKFVKENELQLGDLCLFELVKTAKRLTFIVHISRSTDTLDS